MKIEEYLAEAQRLASKRGQKEPLNSFTLEVGRSVYAAFSGALEDARSDRKRLRVTSAPTGSGKSTFAAAFLSYAYQTDGTRSAFLVETQRQAEDTFTLLKLLLGDEVAVWTAAHDLRLNIPPEETEREKGFKPSAKFYREKLADYPVIVATHASFMGPNSKAFTKGRSLFVVDEKPSDVEIYDIDLAEFTAFRDHIASLGTPLEHLQTPAAALEQYAQSAHANSGRPEDGKWQPFGGLTASEIEDGTRYIAELQGDSGSPSYLMSDHWPAERLNRFLGFAKSLQRGNAFVARYHNGGASGCRFIGYNFNLPIFPGMVLLDATADIDGVSQLASFRDPPIPCPKVDYSNLRLLHVDPPACLQRKKVWTIVNNVRLVDRYKAWAVDLVRRNVRPDEEALIVTAKPYIAHLPREDADEWQGRRVKIINWGSGVGSNRWRTFRHVFLLGEFHIPRRASVAVALGLEGEKPTMAALEDAQSISGLTGRYLVAQEGHLLRWTKQLACRGNVRNIDEVGRCGEMTLYFTGEFERLLRNRELLFPGCKSLTVDTSDHPNYGRDRSRPIIPRIAKYLLSIDFDEVSASDVAEALGCRLRQYFDLLETTDTKTLLCGLGWKFIRGGRGRGNHSRFERVPIPS